MAALHVGSERLLAGFDDWKGSHTLDALRGRRITFLAKARLRFLVSGQGKLGLITFSYSTNTFGLVRFREQDVVIWERS